jgi:arabinan endo-1,5-alpha-L-arabinosidase
MKKLLSFFLILFIYLDAFTQTGSVTLVHDPCITKCNEFYYIYCTGDRIPIRRSTDLLNWVYMGNVFRDIPAWGIQQVPGVSNIWAPDISFFNGNYHLYYSLSTFGSNRSRIGLTTNVTLNPGSADYEWVDQGKVIESNSGDNYNAIDPNIIRAGDGKFWMAFGSFWTGIKAVEIDSVTGKPVNLTLYALAARGGTGAIEAPYIIRREGYYYLFVSFDACCRGVNSTYNIRVGRSASVTGPYTDFWNRPMTSGGATPVLSGDSRWKGPGHCAVYTEADHTWLVYHAYDAQRNGTPVLRINNLTWDDSGWPVVQDTLIATAIPENSHPESCRLKQNFPNPFNTMTRIQFDLDDKQWVTLTVYDIRGTERVCLIDCPFEAGQHQIRVDAAGWPSGIYFYAFHAGTDYGIRKMILMK